MTTDDTLDRLTEAAHQLHQLYPRLRDALAKDQTGGDGRSCASPVPSIPVNPDDEYATPDDHRPETINLVPRCVICGDTWPCEESERFEEEW